MSNEKEEEVNTKKIDHYYKLKYKFIIKSRSKCINHWGRYKLYLYEDGFYLTERSYMCENSEKEKVLIQVPKFMINKVLNQKRMNRRFILDLKQEITTIKAHNLNNF